MADAWQLVYAADGERRADQVLAVMETFCRSLAEFAEIGTRHDDRMPGLRSSGIPRLKRESVLVRVEDARVVALRVGYLGQDVCSDIPATVLNQRKQME